MPQRPPRKVPSAPPRLSGHLPAGFATSTHAGNIHWCYPHNITILCPALVRMWTKMGLTLPTLCTGHELELFIDAEHNAEISGACSSHKDHVRSTHHPWCVRRWDLTAHLQRCPPSKPCNECTPRHTRWCTSWWDLLSPRHHIIGAIYIYGLTAANTEVP